MLVGQGALDYATRKGLACPAGQLVTLQQSENWATYHTLLENAKTAQNTATERKRHPSSQSPTHGAKRQKPTESDESLLMDTVGGICLHDRANFAAVSSGGIAMKYPGSQSNSTPICSLISRAGGRSSCLWCWLLGTRWYLNHQWYFV